MCPVSFFLAMWCGSLFQSQAHALPDTHPPFCGSEYPLVIVGSGLAGHATAAEAIDRMARRPESERRTVIVLDKESRFGGNSMKATSGINGVRTEFQAEGDIEDHLPDFVEDVMYSHTGKRGQLPDSLVTTLTRHSGGAVNWLRHRFGLELPTLAQLGGHSHPRTHRPPAGPAGNIIVKGVHSKLEDLVEFRYNARVTRLLVDDETKAVTGVEYEDASGETVHLRAAAVVMASGGFANDHTETSLLLEHAKHGEQSLATTNGPWATGDGVKLGRAIGARLVDMSAIQVHPTGFVNPKDREAKTKFLAPEALRGSGGLMVNAEGRRFVDELGLRSHVVAEERKQAALGKAPFRLLLNQEAADKFGPNLGFYQKFGLVTKHENVAKMCEEMKLDLAAVTESLEAYNRAAKSEEKDRFGKRFFPVAPFHVEEPVYAAEITPVIHYTMGGLAIDEKAHVIGESGDPINGLFGAGEVTGGVHGKNRLGGNSLLECVVFGRIAAESAISYCDQVNSHKERTATQPESKEDL